LQQLYDNRYKFVKHLGLGGFGNVMLAEETHTNDLVAIKQLHNPDKEKQISIIREMQIISRFNHPNIVIYKHHFKQNDQFFMVMEYCPKGSLRKLIPNRKLSNTYVWKWAQTLCETLQYVHEKNITHRDIKPDNILITENNSLKISDFGIANSDRGTIHYLSPEALHNETSSANDPRVDVYALGVTLLELLTGQNPFYRKSLSEILKIHHKKAFGIELLPDWQQEILLKSIEIIPEQRFQSMKDFSTAVRAQAVPIILDREVIKAGDIAEKAARLLQLKKWKRAYSLLDFAEIKFKPSVSIMRLKAKYFLLQQNIEQSRFYYDKALKWNPRIEVQKELGWINLELNNFPLAISHLSDHLHRNSSDIEAYNLLLKCFYETGRFEQAMDLCSALLESFKRNKCLVNNFYISMTLFNKGKTELPLGVSKYDDGRNPFLLYNQSVVNETASSHAFDNKPSLKSKLLFMDYRFIEPKPAKLYITKLGAENHSTKETDLSIIKLGRETFYANEIKIRGGLSVSRRQCVIINQKDDNWLIDLESTGTYVNDQLVIGKQPLIGRSVVRISSSEFEVTNDRTKLF
jgi:serine/threonine protein kinase